MIPRADLKDLVASALSEDSKEPVAIQPPSFLKIPSTKDCSATVIFLHGLGGSSDGIKPSANVLRSKSSLSHVQFVLPQAPLRSITASMGSVMPAWFDMFSFNLPTGNFVPGEEDEEGMMQSIASLDELLNQLVASGVEPSRIVLGGFSQGAAMSLLTGLTTTRKLAGLFALGARLPIRQKVKTMVSAHAPSVPIFWGHGAADPVVKYSLGRLSADFLVNEIGIPTAPSLGAPTGLDFHTYEGLEHSLCADELDDLALWLEKIIPPSV